MNTLGPVALCTLRASPLARSRDAPVPCRPSVGRSRGRSRLAAEPDGSGRHGYVIHPGQAGNGVRHRPVDCPRRRTPIRPPGPRSSSTPAWSCRGAPVHLTGDLAWFRQKKPRGGRRGKRPVPGWGMKPGYWAHAGMHAMRAPRFARCFVKLSERPEPFRPPFSGVSEGLRCSSPARLPRQCAARESTLMKAPGGPSPARRADAAATHRGDALGLPGCARWPSPAAPAGPGRTQAGQRPARIRSRHPPTGRAPAATSPRQPARRPGTLAGPRHPDASPRPPRGPGCPPPPGQPDPRTPQCTLRRHTTRQASGSDHR